MDLVTLIMMTVQFSHGTILQINACKALIITLNIVLAPKISRLMVVSVEKPPQMTNVRTNTPSWCNMPKTLQISI